MPVSYGENRDALRNWVLKYKPETMFDIGIGYGEIGRDIKSVLYDVELNGVEVFLPYLYHERSFVSIYKRVIIADIKECIGKLWNVDATVAFDIIEHLKKEDGIDVIRYLTSISKYGLLVSVPIIKYPQGIIEDNEAERHLYNWTIPEMEEIGANTIFRGKVTGLFEFKKETT